MSEADLRYPIGRLALPDSVSESERRHHIEQISELPAALSAALQGLGETELDTPYRPGGGPSGRWPTTSPTAT